MLFAYEQCKDSYPAAHTLSGTPADNQLIIPDQGIAYIVRLQVEHLIQKHGLKANTLSRILNDNQVGVDGKPGGRFIKDIVGKASSNAFMDERPNKRMKDLEGNSIDIPHSQDGEDVLYAFFRKMTLTRNGLWSDQLGVCNVIGLRRKVDQRTATQFNDILAQCWTEQENGQVVKRVKLNIATTEPGNLKVRRQLIPQTMTLVPGYHQNRQPAGRTHNALKQSQNLGGLVWSPGDTTMNFHQGKNHFTYKREWLTRHGFDAFIKTGVPNGPMDEKALLDLNHALSEIYLILSKYGNSKRSSYNQLKRMAESNPIEMSPIENGKVTLKQSIGARKAKRTIDLEAAKKWMLDFWFARKKENRLNIIKIVEATSDFDSGDIDRWDKMKKDDIATHITHDHVRSVIAFQTKFVANLNDGGVDGKAGNGFLEFLDGIYQTAQEAKEDFEAIEKWFEVLDRFPIKRPKTFKSVLKSFNINTPVNRRNVRKLTQYDQFKDVGMIENTTVGKSSAGCQVIYDTEVFYEFWTRLLRLAAKSGQTRWYYTLIDITGMRESDVMV